MIGKESMSENALTLACTLLQHGSEAAAALLLQMFPILEQTVKGNVIPVRSNSELNGVLAITPLP